MTSARWGADAMKGMVMRTDANAAASNAVIRVVGLLLSMRIRMRTIVFVMMTM